MKRNGIHSPILDYPGTVRWYQYRPSLLDEFTKASESDKRDYHSPTCQLRHASLECPAEVAEDIIGLVKHVQVRSTTRVPHEPEQAGTQQVDGLGRVRVSIAAARLGDKPRERVAEVDRTDSGQLVGRRGWPPSRHRCCLPCPRVPRVRCPTRAAPGVQRDSGDVIGAHFRWRTRMQISSARHHRYAGVSLHVFPSLLKLSSDRYAPNQYIGVMQSRIIDHIKLRSLSDEGTSRLTTEVSKMAVRNDPRIFAGTEHMARL